MLLITPVVFLHTWKGALLLKSRENSRGGHLKRNDVHVKCNKVKLMNNMTIQKQPLYINYYNERMNIVRNRGNMSQS